MLTVARTGLAAVVCLCSTYRSVAATFSNAQQVMINDSSTATPYPSSIQVQGLFGRVSNVTVTIYGLSHTYPSDVSVLLARPSGESVLLMDHAGGGYVAQNLTLAFDDSAESNLPASSPLVSGVYRPTQFVSRPAFPSPAPPPAYGTTLSVFNQLGPNTEWNLFVLDTVLGCNGSISGGWSIAIATMPAVRILHQPQSRTAEMGSEAEFSVSIEGDPRTAYQWFFNSAHAIDGGTDSLLEFTNVGPAQGGAYTVVITNVYGAVTSDITMLSVIPPVLRKTVPAISLTGDVGSLLHLSCAGTFGPGAAWRELDAVTLATTQQFYPDLSLPLPSSRFYRTWQTNVPNVRPVLQTSLATELTLTGAIGSNVRIDRINQFGPTNAWVTLDTVTLTNTTQLYFDLGMFRQPPRLYRLVPAP